MDALLFPGRLRPGKRIASIGRRLYIYLFIFLFVHVHVNVTGNRPMELPPMELAGLVAFSALVVLCNAS